MGSLQVEKPKRIKVGNGPAYLVGTVRLGTPFPMALLSQDATHPAADKSIDIGKCRPRAVLEVLKPAPERQVYVHDDLGHAVPGVSLGLRPDRVFELLKALGPRPASARREVVAEKVKAVLAFIDQPRLGRVQSQAGGCRLFLHQGQRRGCFLQVSTHHHKVVSIAYHLEAAFGHQVVERVQIDIA